ncbi:hypothetical protein KUTeg_015068 [Tegillarca granosa]|uniref:Uncharacterized protein n=1 Tax=Tegillarca granosa TaxID=220873 RepID=A0ABQ9EP42_TEGGR|nr:hypothetical protein KUTeg_015068 [Tegillarca granosa]
MVVIWTRIFPNTDEEQTSPFRSHPRTSNMPPRNAKPIKYFNLIFSMTLIREIVKQTNSNKLYKEFGIKIISLVLIWKKRLYKYFASLTPCKTDLDCLPASMKQTVKKPHFGVLEISDANSLHDAIRATVAAKIPKIINTIVATIYMSVLDLRILRSSGRTSWFGNN